MHAPSADMRDKGKRESLRLHCDQLAKKFDNTVSAGTVISSSETCDHKIPG
jgi:hypothetical protein